MKYAEMQRILRYCQVIAFEGLNNGNTAIIPELIIHLPKRNTFIGIRGNPAIFVTETTYRKLKHLNQDWIPNSTIAISHTFLIEPRKSCIDIIGLLVHEAGHAFNVHSKIPNTEANAYIFEIEVLSRLLKMQVLTRQFGINKEDLRSYFKSRMSQYNLGVHKNPYLKGLVAKMIENFEINNENNLKPPLKIKIEIGFFKPYGESKNSLEHEQSKASVDLNTEDSILKEKDLNQNAAEIRVGG